MPFGLTNAPATFQRLMENCIGDLHLTYCLLYLDDIIIYSQTYEEHLLRLEAVFKKLREAGLKLSSSKCRFMCTEIKYLGHMISEKGISVDPDKVACVQSWPVPKTVKQVQSFLGFASFYRRFIKNFARIAKPLHEVTLGGEHFQLKTKTKVKYPPLKWGPAQQKAFEELKDVCCQTPILGFADYTQPFVLHTDASGDGLGAVLSQDQNGVRRVIAFASRGISKTERNYPAHKLEFLALRWAVTEKFHDYLYGNNFSVITDNSPLTYVLKNAKLDATGHRWVAQLANYNFTVSYGPGSSNHVADALSRIKWPEVAADVVSQLLRVHVDSTSPVESFCFSQQGIPDDYVQEIGMDAVINWAVEQDSDPDISLVKQMLVDKLTVDNLTPVAKRLLKEKKNLKVIDNKLVMRRVCSGELQYQLVVPSKFREVALSYVHDRMGHLGRDRTLELLRERYYWPGMQQSVVDHIASCGRCIRCKDLNRQRAPLVTTETTQPMELVCIDFLKLEKSKGGIENVLVVTDHFTKYAQAYPTHNQMARTTARTLFEKFFVYYGFPKRVHSDQGRNFESKLIEALCALAGIEKSRTTPYHPMGNGIAERFNSTLINMLGTLESSQKVDWKSHIGSMVHAYNCTKHDTTGFAPYFLMFGCHTRIAVDLALGRHETQCSADYVTNLKDRLKTAYELAEANSRVSQSSQKKFYDQRVRSAVLAPDDRVLVRKVGLKGMQKLADRWSEEVYVVVDQPSPDIPVYRVKPEVGRSHMKTLHRNLLLPISVLPLTKKRPVPVPCKAKSPGSCVENVVEQPPSADETQSETEASDGDSVVDVICVGKPNRVPVLSPRVDINPLDTGSVNLGSDLDEVNGLVSESQHESRMSESSNRDPSESVADLEDQSLEQSVDDSVSTVNHSADDESVAITTPVPAPRRSTRTRTQGHLHPDFVYELVQHTSQSLESEKRESDLELQKIELLQSMIKILK